MAQTAVKTLSAIASLALTQFKLKANRENLAPGHYEGAATVQVRYGMRIGEPYTQAQANTIPWQKLFAVALSKCNAATVQSIVEEALSEGGVSKDQLDAIKADAKCAVDDLLGISEKEHTGKTTGTVELVSILEDAQEPFRPLE